MVIDAFEFARMASSASGHIAVAELLRVDLVRREGSLQWSLAGSSDSRRRPFLDLRVQGDVSVTCQRCLEPVVYPLEIISRLLLVTNQAQAEAEPLDEDAYDVLPITGALDLSELIEDEVILALPLSAMHRECSMPAASIQNGGNAGANEIQSARVLPFAALRTRKGS